MTFKTNVLLVALLALCLAVPAVNADSLTLDAYPANSASDPVVINLGTISDDKLTVTAVNNIPEEHYPLVNFGIVYKGTNYGSSVTITLPHDSSYIDLTAGARNPVANYGISRHYRITYQYVEPTPEPTPVPSPYISVTELYSDNLGTVYRLQCLPDVDTIFYSAIVPYLIPAYQAGQYAEELRSTDTIVEYRVPAGGTSVFSSVYAAYPMTLGVISTTITAPPLTPEQNQTYNPIPDPAQKPLTPFTSGTWQPAITSGQIDVISKSPYIALLSNISDSVQLPVMESPQSVRDRLVPPELENITGPLYDLVDGWADFTNWIPRTIADTVVTLYTPFTTAISDCKTVLLSMTAQLAELMKPMYVLTPVMYLFIPDFVWIGLCMVLVLLILHALAVFVFGYDVTYYYMGRETIVADSVPEFPALEK